MSDVKLMFLDEEYLFPADLWEYLDALSLTENVLRQLKIELERKVRGASSNLISTEDMHPALKEQAAVFVKNCAKKVFIRRLLMNMLLKIADIGCFVKQIRSILMRINGSSLKKWIRLWKV